MKGHHIKQNTDEVSGKTDSPLTSFCSTSENQNTTNIKQHCNKYHPSIDATFLKKLRLSMGLNRSQAAIILSTSVSSIKRYETGALKLSTQKLCSFLERYGVTIAEFNLFKVGALEKFKFDRAITKPDIIRNKTMRRSYQRIITQEIQILIHLRQSLGVSKSDLCKKCGWDKSSIGHIENGRITLTESKLKHILKALKVTKSTFDSYLNSKIDRLSIEKECLTALRLLDDQKLKSIQSILINF